MRIQTPTTYPSGPRTQAYVPMISTSHVRFLPQWGSRVRSALGILVLVAVMLFAICSAPAHALLNDDRFDGNVFALYGSNGGIIPARVTLEKSLEQGIPAVMVFYIDDSSDCKQFAPVIASLQVRYGMGANFLAYNVDALDPEDPTSPGRFYTGQVPQTLIFDREGTVVYQSVGNRSINEVENPIRALFELEPVTNDPTPQLFNEVQTGYKLNQSNQRIPLATAPEVPAAESSSDLSAE
ncbi:MAG: thylakoid membrane photosystem I accumulation factor [Cyanophyceae cyanobacterium]